jgi:hypothetical protein
MTDDTTMAAAMKKAGIKAPIERLRDIIGKVVPQSTDLAVVQAAITNSGDVDAALALIDPQVVAARLKALIREVSGGDQARATQSGQGPVIAADASGDHLQRTKLGQARVIPAVDVRQHQRRFPGHAKPRSAGARKALAISAARGIFAREIGSGRKVVGEVTHFDVVQIKRRGLIDSTIADGLLELDWPDRDKTTLMQFATEEQVSAVFNRAYRALDQLGLPGTAA